MARRSYSASQYSGGSKKSKSKSKSYSPPRGGGADMGTVSTPTRKANPTLALNSLIEQRKTDQVNRRIAANKEARAMALTPPKRNLRQKIGGGINRVLNNPFVRTYAAWGTGGLSEKMRQAMGIKSLYDNRNILDDEAIEEEVRNIPVTGGIGDMFSNLLGFSHAGAAEMTQQDLIEIGAMEPGKVWGHNLTDEGKALEDFRKSAVGFKEAEKNTANTPQAALNFMQNKPGLFGNILDNQQFIQGAIDKGFLAEPTDYQIQKPLKEYLANGGVVGLFKNGGYLG